MADIYCTLFDKNYLYQGLTLYSSLVRHAGDFVLYVLAMDDRTHDVLTRLGREDLISIPLRELETPEVLRAKAGMTHGQYCWTSQPVLCQYVLDRYKAPMITYLEADSMFFSSPRPLFEELGPDSVSLVPHRYSPGFDQSATSGKYCVQFNAFRDDARGRAVLADWRTECFRYNREQPLFFPGQLCLDSWESKFQGVRELKHLGAGVAPWNVQRFNIERRGEDVYVDDVPAVFYHFHEYARTPDGRHELGGYPLPDAAIEFFYKPYARALAATETWVRSVDPDFHFRKEQRPAGAISACLTALKRRLRGTYNVYSNEQLLGD